MFSKSPDVIAAKLENAKKENEFVFHEKVSFVRFSSSFNKNSLSQASSELFHRLTEN